MSYVRACRRSLKRSRMPRFSIGRRLSRRWTLLVAVVMAVFGPPGTVATITYLDVTAQPQRVDAATLPWAYDTTTTQPAVFVNVSAQGDGNSIGCRIKIDNAVKDERSVNTLNAYTYCLDKSG